MQARPNFTSDGGDIVVYLPRDLPVTIDARIQMGDDHHVIADPAFPLKVSYDDSVEGTRSVRAEGALNGGRRIAEVANGLRRYSRGCERHEASKIEIYKQQMQELQQQMQEQIQLQLRALQQSQDSGETQPRPDTRASRKMGTPGSQSIAGRKSHLRTDVRGRREALRQGRAVDSRELHAGHSESTTRRSGEPLRVRSLAAFILCVSPSRFGATITTIIPATYPLDAGGSFHARKCERFGPGGRMGPRRGRSPRGENVASESAMTSNK